MDSNQISSYQGNHRDVNKGSANPRVSVIIPTYNRKDYVQETIDSVLAQTFTDYEIIVIDDGSTDATQETLASRYGDQIHYIWQENQGESVARNHGIDISKGEFIAFLDSDDLWLPEKLAKQVEVLTQNSDSVLNFTGYWQIDGEGRRLDDHPSGMDIKEIQLTLETLCLQNVVGSPSTAIIRREVIERIGKFDATIQYGEDWDLWLRLRGQGNFIHLNEPLVCFRAHSGSQWHNPRLETIDRRLADHLRLLEKVFNNWPGEIPMNLPDRANARAYGMAAFFDYLSGRILLGKERLELAIRLDPEYRSELEKLPEQLLYYYIFSYSELSIKRTPKTTLNIATQAFDQWPIELNFSKQLKDRMFKDLFSHYLYTSYKLKDFSTTRYCLLKSMRYDPSLLGNRGVWSIGFQAFLGIRTVSWLQRVLR